MNVSLRRFNMSRRNVYQSHPLNRLVHARQEALVGFHDMDCSCDAIGQVRMAEPRTRYHLLQNPVFAACPRVFRISRVSLKIEIGTPYLHQHIFVSEWRSNIT